MYQIPESALAYGLVSATIGAHTSRTIMLSELRLLLSSCPANAGTEGYRSAIVENNVLLKSTASTCRESFRRLRELYGLSPRLLLFRALRDLWEADVSAQPLLALLSAVARDPLLRTTADVIVSTPTGGAVSPQQISDAAAAAFPDRFNSTTLANIGRHAASSWQQSGHLAGRLTKTRATAVCRPTVVAYALFLGYLCGARGEGLFDTLWCRLLDAPAHVLHDQAFTASQQGWLEYRHSGMVTEITFRHLLRTEA